MSEIILENYPTPPWVVHRLLESAALPGGDWLEPCAGAGALVKAVNEKRTDIDWELNELRAVEEANLKSLSRRVRTGNFLDATYAPRAKVMITNPPFSEAVSFLEKGWAVSDHVVLLLRLSFLSSIGRYAILKNTVPDVYILPERPSFAFGKTDKWDYAWFHWGPTRQAWGKTTYLRKTDPNVIREWKRAFKDGV